MRNTVYPLIVVFFFLGVGGGCTFFKKDGTSECRPEYMFPPGVPGVDYLEFMAVGDAGSGGNGQRIVADSMREYALRNPVQFVLYLGDNFYDSGVSSVDDPMFETHFEDVYDGVVLNMPFYVVVGNHDYRGDVNAQVVYSGRSERWNMPALYYTFTVRYGELGKVQFFGLDTDPIVTGGDFENQLVWLEDELGRSEAGWKVVFGHHPVYSNGLYGNLPEMIDTVLPLLEGYGVDVYISGHEHDLQLLEPVNGVHQVVSGAGASVRDTLCRENSIYAAGLLGFMAFRVSREEMVISVILDEGKRDYAYVISK